VKRLVSQLLKPSPRKWQEVLLGMIHGHAQHQAKVDEHNATGLSGEATDVDPAFR
jgi:hypothetical protein